VTAGEGLKSSRGYVFIALVLAAPVIAAIVGLFTDFGRGARSDYYATAAVISVTAFVLLVGVSVVMAPHLAVANRQTYLSNLALGLVLQVIIGVGLALGATAADASSTFLCLTVAITLFNQAVASTFFAFGGAVPELIARSGETIPPRS